MRFPWQTMCTANRRKKNTMIWYDTIGISQGKTGKTKILLSLWYIRQHHFPDKNKPKRILWTQLNKSLLIKMIVSYNTACIEVFHNTFFFLLCGRLRPNEWIECNELKNIFGLWGRSFKKLITWQKLETIFFMRTENKNLHKNCS